MCFGSCLTPPLTWSHSQLPLSPIFHFCSWTNNLYGKFAIFHSLSLAYLSHFNHLLTEEEMEEEVMRNMKDYVDGGKFDLFDAVLIGSLDFIS